MSFIRLATARANLMASTSSSRQLSLSSRYSSALKRSLYVPIRSDRNSRPFFSSGRSVASALIFPNISLNNFVVHIVRSLNRPRIPLCISSKYTIWWILAVFLDHCHGLVNHVLLEHIGCQFLLSQPQRVGKACSARRSVLALFREGAITMQFRARHRKYDNRKYPKLGL